jgi:hypothetical protein
MHKGVPIGLHQKTRPIPIAGNYPQARLPGANRDIVEHREAEAWGLQVESEMTRGVFVSRVESERANLKELIERYVQEITPKHKGCGSETLRLHSQAVVLLLPCLKPCLADMPFT